MATKTDHHEYCTGGFEANDIVISGIAGRFSCCNSVREFKDALFAKKNLMIFSNDRYEKGAIGNQFSSCGVVQDIDKFDNDYFCITSSMAQKLDPSQRKVLEVSCEAIFDSGYDIEELKGANIGVYNATTGEDSKNIQIYAGLEADLSHFLGMVRSMNANRCSRAFDFHGPSIVMDSACSSSASALWCAWNDIREGRAEAAIVNGCQLNLSPHVAACYNPIMSQTGKCTPFDAEANGILRTEAAGALFLQKASSARRAYATVVVVNQIANGYVPEGISVPSPKMQVQLYEKNLKEAGVSVDEINFVEAHGTGTAIGDPVELNAISEAYSKNRKKPLYIGTVKSNIGHSEAVAGIVSMVKALLAFETGLIPPNINFKTPNLACEPLSSGRLQVVTEPVPLSSHYIPVNSFGIGGSLVQVILKQNPVTYSSRETEKSLPRLVLYPATTEKAILDLFHFIGDTGNLTDEFFALLNKLAFAPTLLKPFRGFALFQNSNCPVTEIKHCLSRKREVWFIMTGMGCQWPGMGLQLMELDVFAKSMRKSAEILKPFGIDLFEVLEKDKNCLKIERSITPAFVSIAAIQIAFIDLLRSIDIHPDGITGHSTGELAAGYADGCCTAEQTILSAYWRGKSVESANLPLSAMAAVGLSWEEAKNRCPPGVYPACHNADDSVTISGLKKPLEDFVANLQKENVFARAVDTYGYGFHSPLITAAADILRPCLEKVIPNPKARSCRWISSSFPENEWESENCRLAGAEYFIRNLASTVHFNEAVKKIPSDAIAIEIGPHFALQALLKRVLGSKATCIGLMKRNDENNLNFFMETLGKLYNEGLNPKIENLYPPVKFPVPRSTPMISDLIKWNYSSTFPVPKWTHNQGALCHVFNLQGRDSFLKDHRIDGRSLFPATGYVFLAWKALVDKNKSVFEDTAVVIEDFKIHRAVILSESGDLEFNVSLEDIGGHFQVTEGHSLLASGNIRKQSDVTFEDIKDVAIESSAIPGKDLYNELRIRGYEYGPAFRGLHQMNLNGTGGVVSWNGNWITFLDSLLLFFGLTDDCSSLYLPTGAQSIKIDPKVLKEYAAGFEENQIRNLPVKYNVAARMCTSVGVEIKQLLIDPAPRRAKSDDSIFNEYKFISYIHDFVPTKNVQQNMLSYKCLCNKIIDEIGQMLQLDVKNAKFLNVDMKDSNLRTSLNDNSSREVLLTALKQISHIDNSSGIKEKAKAAFGYYLQSIRKDILNYILIDEPPLRIMLDIIAENTSRKLNLLEVTNSTSFLLPTIVDTVHRYSLFKLKSAIIAIMSESIENQEVSGANGIQLRSSKDMISLYREKDQDVVVSSFICGTLSDLKTLVRELSSLVKPGGFILFHFKSKANPAENFLSSLCGGNLCIVSELELQGVLKNENLTVVSKMNDSLFGSLYLIRTVVPEVPCQVVHAENNGYNWVTELKMHLCKDSPDTIWLVSSDVSSGIVGMVNCLRREPGGERIKCVFIPRTDQGTQLPPFSLEDEFYRDLVKKNLLMNIWHDGKWGSFRHFILGKEKPSREVEHSFINCNKYGDLSSFQWKESSVQYTGASKEDLVHIYYSALNFKDVMLASGKLSIGVAKGKDQGDDCVLGIEFSGRRPCGRRVAGLLKCNGLATAAIANPQVCFDVPDHWTLEEAATVPVVYATCYYALLIRGNLRRSESILIHSGTGGIGLAAIAIALDLECEIFTTVGNEQKKEYLKKKFPQIKDENIGCSRDLSFEDMICNKTGGRGVNIILNSLADEKFQASLRCLAKHGRFVEIGKYDLSMDRSIGLKIFLKNVVFHGVSLDQLMDGTPEGSYDLGKVMDLLKEGCENNVVQPLDRTVFDRNEAEKAFRYMAGGTHTGKVVLKIRDEEHSIQAVPRTLRLPAVPNTYFYSWKVYIVVGGLGGFGIELTKWLLNRGARNVILTSRHGVRTPYHRLCLKRWTDRGFRVRVSTLNVAKKHEAKRLLMEALEVGYVGGIFNSAVVLRDAFIENQNPTLFAEVCEPKALATKHLDELSRQMCPTLDYFVCFSSMSCGRGNAGQSNYGYANSVMERICEQRRSKGLHGLAIQWGIIGDVGVMHRHMGDDAVIAGVCAQSVNSCLSTLDVFCQLGHPVVSSHVSAELSTKPKTAKDDVVSKILNILGQKEVNDTNRNRTFMEIGIDSLMGTELVQLLESTSDLTLTITDIQNMKLGDLITLLDTAESAKESEEKPSLLVTTSTVTLPSFLLPKEPLTHLNKVADGTPVFVVTMGDVDISILRILGNNISRPVFGLLWAKEAPSTDMKALAAWYSQIIRNSCNGSFHLVGFSAGGSLAFEIALRDEESSRNLNTLSLLDGSAALVNAVSRADISSESTTLCKFVELLIPGGMPKLESALLKGNDLEERILITLNILVNCSSQSIDKNDLQEAIQAYLNKMKLVQTYLPQKKFTKDLNVIEDSQRLLANDVSEYKSALSEVCSGKVFVHRLPLECCQVSNQESIQNLAELLNSVFEKE